MKPPQFAFARAQRALGLITVLMTAFTFDAHAVRRSDKDCDEALRPRGAYVASVESRIIRDKFDCTSCDTKGVTSVLRAGEKVERCSSCGSPRSETEGESWYQDGKRDARGRVIDAQAVTDVDGLRIAQSGADWSCTYCAAGNHATLGKCAHCGAERVEDAPAVSPRRELTTTVTPRRAGPSFLRRAMIGAVGLAGASGIASSVWWALMTHAVVGHVTSMHWEHNVDRQTYVVDSNHSGWENSVYPRPPVMPVNGHGEFPGVFDIRNVRRELHHTDHVIVGHHPERYTERVRDPVDSCHQGTCTVTPLDNGTSREDCPTICEASYHNEPRTRIVDDYANIPVYADRVDYSTYAWGGVGSIDATARGDAPMPAEYSSGHLPWPAIAPGPVDRLVPSESYRVVISYEFKGETRTHEVTPGAEGEFLGWHSGDAVELEVRNIGGVAEMRRPLGGTEP